MSWGAERQGLIIAGIVIVLAFVAALIIIPIVYHAPSCTDGIQNQKEDGVDCGGPCAYLCTALVPDPNPPRFTRAIPGSPGMTDIISYVDTGLGVAAKSAEYSVDLYDAGNVLLGTKTGVTDLPPESTVPIFIPNIFTGNRSVARAFLTIATSSLHWYSYTDARVKLSVRNIQLQNTQTPRVTATLENPSADVLTNIKVVVTVFDANGTAIAASETVLPVIPPQGTAQAIFTWNVPFAEDPSRIDVLPRIPLPAGRQGFLAQ